MDEVSLTAVAMERMLPRTCLTMAPPSRAVSAALRAVSAADWVWRETSAMEADISCMAVAACWVCWLCWSMRRWTWSLAVRMEAALPVRVPAVSTTSADDGGEAGLHLLHGEGEAADLVGRCRR